MMPLSISGVMEVQRFRSIFVQSLLSQHLGVTIKNQINQTLTALTNQK